MATTAPAWLPTAGDTCLQDGPNGRHLWVVVHGPEACPGYGQPPHVITVSVTTLRAGNSHDPACILHAGDHPFIQHDSWIYYRAARLDPLADAQLHVANALWIPHQPFSPQLLVRVRAGLCASALASREFKRLIGCF